MSLCSGRKTNRNSNTILLFPGWGTASVSGPASGSLRVSNLRVAPMSKCAEIYKNETERNQLCTYFPKVNPCQVDSGGPLLWSDPATGKLNVVGIVSNRFTCAETTVSMQTRLATVNNMHWIKVVLTGKDIHNILEIFQKL